MAENHSDDSLHEQEPIGDNLGIDWNLRQRTSVKQLLNLFERLSLAIEKPIAIITGEQSLNPLYHTGTITTFLLFIILITGAYLTFFYQFGFDATYTAMVTIEANLVGRIMRALHKYSSGAVVITALLHGWRTFFQDRFRGPRWLAWVSGIVMAAFVWFIGITGYWLIWDERAQLLNQTLFNLIGSTKTGTTFLINTLVSDNASSGWVFIILIISIHLGLSAVVGLFYYWHIKRLTRLKVFPPKYWMWIIGGLLILFSVLFPVGLISQADFGKIPTNIPIDLFYLFYLPQALKVSPWLFWGGIMLFFLVSGAIPWLLIRKPLVPVFVDSERCIGCKLCEADCPYKAIKMVDRKEGIGSKELAELDSNLCVACGICIGSCPTLALTMGNIPQEPLWEKAINYAKMEVESPPSRVIFTCERHAFQGGKPFLSRRGNQIIPVTCVGMLHPDLISKTVIAGADEVLVIGCPPEDCANREGNKHLQDRLDGIRKPILRSKFGDLPIRTIWLPPNEFKHAISARKTNSQVTSYGTQISKFSWLRLMSVVLLLGVVFGVVFFGGRFIYNPATAEIAHLEIVLNHLPGYPIEGIDSTLEPRMGIESDTRISVEIDNELFLDESYPRRGRDFRSQIFERFPLNPGLRHIIIQMYDRDDQFLSQTIFEKRVDLKPGQVLRLNFTDSNIGKDPIAGRKLYWERNWSSLSYIWIII